MPTRALAVLVMRVAERTRGAWHDSPCTAAPDQEGGNAAPELLVAGRRDVECALSGANPV